MAKPGPHSALKPPSRVTEARFKQLTPGKGWRSRWRVDGRQFERRFRTRDEAQHWARAINNAAAAGEPFGPNGLPMSWNRAALSMKKTAELYFAANAADWAQATAYSSRLYVTRFVEALASDDVQMLTRASAAAALAKTEIRHDGTGRLSNSTRRTVNGTIKAFLNWMIDMEMIDANPLDQRRRRPTASKVQSTKIDAHGLPSVKQAWEMIDRVRNAETRLGAEIILRTGLRPGEVRGLHGEDIRDDHIHVVRTATNKGLGKRTKTGKVRDVPAPADLLERMRSDTWLFPGTKENVVVDQAFFRRHWREVVSEIRMHDLRHIHATVLLRERVPIPQAAAWLGHSPAVLMSTYAGVLEDLDLRDRVDRAFLDDRPATFDRQDETP